MNILGTLRKSYLSIFLSALTLFFSCSQENDINQDKMELSQLVSKHLNLTGDLSLSITNFTNTQRNNSNDDVYHLDNIDELIQNMSITNNQEARENITNMVNNITTFLNSNPELLELGEEGVMELISIEVDNQLENENNSYATRFGPCEDARATGESRCQRNYAISMAGAAVAGFFSMGTGWVIGVVAIQAVAIACNGDVMSDYRECTQNQ